MKILVSILLIVVSLGAFAVVIANLIENPNIDYWNLDLEEKDNLPESNFFRKKPIFYGAVAILVAEYIAYLVLRKLHLL